MSEAIQLIGAHFAGEDDAETTLESLRRSAVRMYNAAVLRTDGDGKMHIHQFHHLNDSGDSWGGIIAASAGVFAGLLMVPAAVATAFAGVGAVLLAGQTGSSDLRQLAKNVAPNSSTLLVTCPPRQAAALLAELRPRATAIHSDVVTPETIAKLDGGQKFVQEALAQAAYGVHAVASYYSTTRY